MDDSIIKFDYPTARPSIIKVIGVGGGGGNAVSHMYKEGIHDVTFVLCNTDFQALSESEVPVKLQLGKTITEGLGAGNNPEKARKAAEESEEELKKLLDDGTKMVFITAGMGGGTGTGAAPVIARIAKGMDILTVGIVTIPFLFELEPKIIQALNGVEEISKNVDALLVINNERLREIYQDLTVMNAFKKADDTLAVAAKSIAEIITVPGHINLDFADVHTILKDGGVAIMSSGLGSGESRVPKAIENALHSPLLNNNSVFRAKKVLLNISFSESSPLMMEEMNHINDFMIKFNRGVDSFIWGAAIEEGLGDKVKVTILATGFSMEDIPMMPEKKERDKDKVSEEELRKEKLRQAQEEERKRRNLQLIKDYYGDDYSSIGKKTRPKPWIFSLEQMDDDQIIELIVSNAAYNRDSKVMTQAMADAVARITDFEEETLEEPDKTPSAGNTIEF